MVTSRADSAPTTPDSSAPDSSAPDGLAPATPDVQWGPAPLDVKLANVLGGRTAQALEKAFGHRTVGEFLEHYPRRYADAVS